MTEAAPTDPAVSGIGPADGPAGSAQAQPASTLVPESRSVGAASRVGRKPAGPAGRLLAAEDFSRVLQGSRVGASRHFELFSARLPAATSPAARIRVGMAISKRAAKLAVLRNLAKRIARESARSAALAGLAEGDYVVRSRLVLGADWQAAKLAKQTQAFRRQMRAEIDGLFARRIAEHGGDQK